MQMQEGSLQLQLLFRLVYFKLHLRKSAVPDYLRGPILKMTSLIVLRGAPLCQHTDAVSSSLKLWQSQLPPGCVSILENSMIYLLFKKAIG